MKSDTAEHEALAACKINSQLPKGTKKKEFLELRHMLSKHCTQSNTDK